MYDDRSGFIRAIIDAPDDDNPRMIYADWLDDQGEGERAEFIRTQVALALAPHNHKHKDFGGDPDGCRACHLKRAAHRIVRAGYPANGYRWGGELLAPTDNEDRYTYRRGFIDAVTVQPAGWEKVADALLAAHPVRLVRFLSAPADLSNYEYSGAGFPWRHTKKWKQIKFAFDLPRDPTFDPWGDPTQTYIPMPYGEAVVEPGEPLSLGDYVYPDGLGRARRTTFAPATVVGYVIGLHERGYLPGRDGVRVRLLGGNRLWTTAINPLADTARRIEDVCRRDGSVPDGYRTEWQFDLQLPDERRSWLVIQHPAREEALRLERRPYPWLDQMFHRVDLRRERFQQARQLWDRERYSFYRGRCDECRVVYFAGLMREDDR